LVSVGSIQNFINFEHVETKQDNGIFYKLMY